MHEAQNPAQVVALLRSSYPSSTTIAIDGIDGAGKSTLARAIHASIAGTLLHLDDFVNKNQGYYVQALRIPELRAAIETASPPVIVEGICVLAVMNAVELRADLLIYVKQIDSHGHWSEEDVCDPSDPADVIVAAELQLAQRVAAALEDPRPTSLGLREEIIRYHCDFRPMDQADILYVCEAAA